MIELLQLEFMRNAVIAAFLISVAFGVVGSYVVVRRWTFISGGIAHAAFGGIGLGYYLGVNPLISAIPFSAFVALIVGLLRKKASLSYDTAIGMIWALGMAIGILFIYLTPGYAPDLFSYLFGNILTISGPDLALMAALNLLILSSVFLLFEQLKSVSFDEEFSEVIGLKTDLIDLGLLCLIALSVVLLVKVVGIVLVIALLTIPASISKMYTYNLKKMMVYSSILGLLLVLSGLYLSYELNMPSGATIILLAGLLFALSYAYKHFSRQKIPKCS